LFEQYQDIARISQKLGKDPSGVSRAIKKLADKYPVLEKRTGRWQLTELGTRLNNLSRDFIKIQASTLKSQERIRIGSNREFASRVIAPRITEISALIPETKIDLFSYEKGVEHALKAGAMDIGFDCGRPTDPSVAYKMLANEPISTYCSKSFAKQFKKQITSQEWKALPHILCERLYPDRIMNLAEIDWNVAFHVNDISLARELAVRGEGWALLPSYSVSREIAAGELIQMGNESYEIEKYGIWWLRERKYLTPAVQALSDWLKKVPLD
ncbi:MAG: LysR family transcriptional regulator, partial [Bdellovibrionota bacterium]